MRPNISSRRPITAYAKVTNNVHEISVEEPPITLATASPIGMKNSPPIVGVPFFE